MTPDERVDWLIEHGAIFSTPLHHETYVALRSAYGELSDDGRQRLLDVIDKGSGEEAIRSDADLAIRVRFDLVDWLLAENPRDAELRRRRTALLEERPEMASRTHPEFLWWMEAGFVARPDKADVEALSKRDLTDPATVAELIARSEGSLPSEGTALTAQATLEQVRESAREQPGWSIDLATQLADRGEWQSRLWTATSEGWVEADLDQAQWARVLELIRVHGNPGPHLDAFTQLLDRGLRSSPPRIPAELLPDVEALAYGLWPTAVAQADLELVTEDWVMRALNHSAGRLALVLIQLLSLDRPLPNGIEGERLKQLGLMLSEPSDAGGFARAIFGSQVHFLIALDRPWTLANVVPWFDWAQDRVRALQAWQGFLTWGQLSPDVGAALLTGYRSTFSQIDELGEHRHRFAEHMSALPFLVDPRPIEGSWLFEFVRSASPDDLSEWARQVGSQLERMDETTREKGWETWIEPYWRLRVRGRPRALVAHEAGAMLGWAMQLDSVFEAAVALAREMPPARSERGLLHELRDKNLPETHPEAAAQLTALALAGQRRDAFWECEHALDVTHRVQGTGHVSQRTNAELGEELVRLGCRSPSTPSPT